MRRLIIAALLAVAPVAANAAGGHGVALEDANIDLADVGSLQRGAKYFVNHCMGCHSLQYMRYNRLAEDLDIDAATLRETLIFGDAKPGDHMTNAMNLEDGEKWFGKSVPDLTLVTRWRNPDWVYTYLKSFYVDDSRPYGVNNLVFPDVGMPNVLGPLQGVQEAVYAHHEEGHGEAKGSDHIEGLELVEEGMLSAAEYDGVVRDITNFLTYAGEPVRLERQQLGVKVLIFLGFFFILTYVLKKEFWKDVH